MYKRQCATLSVFEQTGVFTDKIKFWNRRPAVEHTLANMKTAFNRANDERLTHATTNNAGYHGTHHAAGAGFPMFYCWTHGLGPESQHTSATCTRPTANHNQLATADNMLGGNRSIPNVGKFASVRGWARSPTPTVFSS